MIPTSILFLHKQRFLTIIILDFVIPLRKNIYIFLHVIILYINNNVIFFVPKGMTNF